MNDERDDVEEVGSAIAGGIVGFLLLAAIVIVIVAMAVSGG